MFTKYWKAYIDDVTSRENFKMGHLRTLEVLCDMYVEYEKLETILDMEGYTYESRNSRGANTINRRPEVEQIKGVRQQIALYTRMLGLVLTKDTQAAEPPEKDEWE